MKRILHVDNSHFFRKQAAIFLAREGFEVEGFNNGEDASFVVNGSDIAMILCGLSLSDMDGKDFIKRVREYFAGPIIIISSSIENEDDEALRELGVTAALKKSGGWQEALRPYLALL